MAASRKAIGICPQILKMINGADLPDAPKRNAAAVLQRLGEAEVRFMECRFGVAINQIITTLPGS